jgi:hypothetical protein
LGEAVGAATDVMLEECENSRVFKVIS